MKREKEMGPELVEHATEVIKKIWQQMKTAQSRQKSYADKRRRPLEFEVGDKVFLKRLQLEESRDFVRRAN